MNLTIDETVAILELWNAWYLLEHDETLRSDYSENHVEITVSPIDNSSIPQSVVDDLQDYTDHLNMDEPDVFKIEFIFPAKDYQPREIFSSIKPILDLAHGSSVTIINRMDFIETDLPPGDETEFAVEKGIRQEIEKYHWQSSQKEEQNNQGEEESEEEESPTPSPYQKEGEQEEYPVDYGTVHPKDKKADREEAGKSTEEEKKAQDGEEKTEENLPLPVNRIEIKGKISAHSLEIETILHNNEPIKDFASFLEASRLFETIKTNFDQTPQKEEDAKIDEDKVFICHDEKEAQMVKFYTNIVLYYKVLKILPDGKTLKTNADGEELATLITYIRYKNKIHLFDNPLLPRLKAHQRLRREVTKDLIKNSCSCFFILIFFLVMMWLWYMGNPKK